MGLADMYKRAMAFIQKHQLLDQSKTVLAGVSGGPDSMALLHFLRSIQHIYDLRIIVVSVDHQLRGEASRDDLEYVRRTCLAWEIPFYGAPVDVFAYQKKTKLGTEVAARALRYQIFGEQMLKHQADYLALGHHGDDQAETMLMGLVRSANPSALSGIPFRRPFAEGELIRPLLGCSREEIETYCNEHQLHPRHDLTNDEPAFTRNFFRKYVMPLLKQQNPKMHTTAQHLSNVLQTDEQFLHDVAARQFTDVVTLDEITGAATFQIHDFKSFPVALQRRFYHLILNYLYDELPKDLSYIHEEQFFALLMSEQANVQIDFPGQLKIEKAYQHLYVYCPFQAARHTDFHEILPVPGKLQLPDGSVIYAEWTNDLIETTYTYICGHDQITLPLYVRTRQDGDRMQWKGLQGRKKVKDILMDEKIPLHDRDKWPIVTDTKGEILWLVGLRKGLLPYSDECAAHIKLRYVKSE